MTTLKSRHAAVEFVLFDQRVEIDFDLRGVLVGIDFEVTEEAALTAERNVNIKAKRIFDSRRLVQHVERRGNKLRFPLRKRRIVRDKVIPYFSLALRDVDGHSKINLASTGMIANCQLPIFNWQSAISSRQ